MMSALLPLLLQMLLLLQCVNAMRQQQSISSHEAADVMNLRMKGDAISSERTFARFTSAFPEMHAADSTCPYGDVAESLSGGTTSFSCHWKSEGKGKTCPALQQERLKPARSFIASNYSTFVDAAKDFPLRTPLFDKTPKLQGDETYEALVKLHIENLLHPDSASLEDKLFLKATAEQHGVPRRHRTSGRTSNSGMRIR